MMLHGPYLSMPGGDDEGPASLLVQQAAEGLGEGVACDDFIVFFVSHSPF